MFPGMPAVLCCGISSNFRWSGYPYVCIARDCATCYHGPLPAGRAIGASATGVFHGCPKRKTIPGRLAERPRGLAGSGAGAERHYLPQALPYGPHAGRTIRPATRPQLPRPDDFPVTHHPPTRGPVLHRSRKPAGPVASPAGPVRALLQRGCGPTPPNALRHL